MTQEEITRNFDSYRSKSKTFLLGKFERMRKANLAKYYLFDESDKIAHVLVPDDDTNVETVRNIASMAGGQKTTPNLQ